MVLGAVAEGDFFLGPAGFTAVGVFTVSTADIIPTVGAVFLFSPCNCIRLTAYSTNVRRADAAAQRLYIPSDSRRNKRMCSGHSPFSQRCKGAQRDEVTGGELGLRHAGKFADCLYACVLRPIAFQVPGHAPWVECRPRPRGTRGAASDTNASWSGGNRFAPKGVNWWLVMCFTSLAKLIVVELGS